VRKRKTGQNDLFNSSDPFLFGFDIFGIIDAGTNDVTDETEHYFDSDGNLHEVATPPAPKPPPDYSGEAEG
jgi:hypothetical protein